MGNARRDETVMRIFLGALGSSDEARHSRHWSLIQEFLRHKQAEFLEFWRSKRGTEGEERERRPSPAGQEAAAAVKTETDLDLPLKEEEIEPSQGNALNQGSGSAATSEAEHEVESMPADDANAKPSSSVAEVNKASGTATAVHSGSEIVKLLGVRFPVRATNRRQYRCQACGRFHRTEEERDEHQAGCQGARLRLREDGTVVGIASVSVSTSTSSNVEKQKEPRFPTRDTDKKKFRCQVCGRFYNTQPPRDKHEADCQGGRQVSRKKSSGSKSTVPQAREEEERDGNLDVEEELRFPSRETDRCKFRCQVCGRYYNTGRKRDEHQASCVGETPGPSNLNKNRQKLRKWCLSKMSEGTE